MKNSDIVVLDLDGTLANIKHRLHFIDGDKKDYKSFYEACDKDSLNEWCDQIMMGMHMAEHRIYIVTCRSDVVRTKTRDWISEQTCALYCNPILVMLRKDKDYRPATELKRRWASSYGTKNICLAIDDDPKVVAMYRDLGIPTLDCGRK